MSLQNTLIRIIKAVIKEAERNPDFEIALNEALGTSSSKNNQIKRSHSVDSAGLGKRAKNRRAPALLDPVQLIRDGEATLRAALRGMSLDQLRDIVAEYGMDTSKLVMKWVDSERVEDRIVEIATARARKGDAFRKAADDSQQRQSPETSGPATIPADAPANTSSEVESRSKF